MAKGLRASSRKKNNQVLRAKVFAPAVDARTERLSAKLQQLAAQPRPDQERAEKAMDVDEKSEDQPEHQKPTDSDDDNMDVDTQTAKSKPVKRQNVRTGGRGRIEKKIAKRKEKNSIVFAHVRAKWARSAKSKKKK